jgi:glucan phosphoethanolaminetransferase (alkaline phosphatase superfamily)
MNYQEYLKQVSNTYHEESWGKINAAFYYALYCFCCFFLSFIIGIFLISIKLSILAIPVFILCFSTTYFLSKWYKKKNKEISDRMKKARENLYADYLSQK